MRWSQWSRISGMAVLIVLLAGSRVLPNAAQGERGLSAEKAAELFEACQKLQEEKKLAEAIRGYRRIVDSGLPGELPSSAAHALAIIHVGMGKKDQAITWLEKAVELGFGDPASLETDEDLAALREQPRFRELQARLTRLRDGGPPTGTCVATLHLVDEDLEIYTEAGTPPGRGDYLAYQVCRMGMPAYLILGRAGGIVRFKEPGAGGEELAVTSPSLASNQEVLPLADLVWDAILLREWERKGDELLKKAEKEKKPPNHAYAAFENALHPVLARRSALERLAGPYLKLMKDSATPRATLGIAAGTIALLPEPGEAEESPELSLARAGAYFFLRAYPLAAEALKKIADAPDARGLTEVLKALGANDWTPSGPTAIESVPVMSWTAGGKPEDAGLPAYESCTIVRTSSGLRSFLLTRRAVGGSDSYFLHAASGGSEVLLEAFGKKKPSPEELQARIAVALRGRPASPRGLVRIPPPRSLPPLLKGEPGRMEVRWGGESRTERLELRREALEAGVWLGGSTSPAVVKGLAPGTYAAFLRDGRGRVIVERRVTVDPGTKLVIDVDRF